MSAHHHKKEEWINFWDTESKPVYGDNGVDISNKAIIDYAIKHQFTNVDIDNLSFIAKDSIRTCIIYRHTRKMLNNNWRRLHHLPMIRRCNYE